MRRAVIIVLDSVGIGELPDADKYGDRGSNTLVNIKKAVPGMSLKNLCRLGLPLIEGGETHLLGQCESPEGAYGRMAEKSSGKDTTTGHWEIAGLVTERPFPTFTETGFPADFIADFERAIGRKILGNYAASGTEIIKELGNEHVKTGAPIVYTSADSVFQIAAHEDAIPPEELYKICLKARELLKDDLAVARVIARPFTGGSGQYTRTKNRRDFSLLPPGETMLDAVKAAGLEVCAVGKIEDIFGGRGVTSSVHTRDNAEGIDKTIDFLKKCKKGIVFSNLVDYDMLYGHRNDIEGYAAALEYFDRRLPEILAALGPEDMLIITADHGCDPTTQSTDHSREYAPLLVAGECVRAGAALGTRKSFADIGATVCEYLDVAYSFNGDSFLVDILHE